MFFLDLSNCLSGFSIYGISPKIRRNLSLVGCADFLLMLLFLFAGKILTEISIIIVQYFMFVKIANYAGMSSIVHPQEGIGIYMLPP